MSPAISPSSTNRSTSDMATTPPNCMVTLRRSSSRPLPSVATCTTSPASRDGLGQLEAGLGAKPTHATVRFGLLQFSGAPPRRQQALGTEDHHCDQGGAERHDPVLLKRPEPFGQVPDDDGAEDHAR